MATTLNRIRRIGYRDSVAVLCQGRECIPKEAQRHNTEPCRMQNVHPSIIATPVALVATELDDRLTADAGLLLIRLASRENELAHTFPLHVVTEWLGNTPQVALKHYLRVTDEDFAEATQSVAEGGAKSGAQVAQNAAQQAHAPTGKKRQKPLTGRGLCETVRRLAMWCQRPKWRGQDSKSLLFSGGKRTL